MTTTTTNSTTIDTPHLGLVEVREEEIIHLLAPLPPFAGLMRYVLLSHSEQEPLAWFVCVDQPALAFVVVPHEAVAGPAPALSANVRQELRLTSCEEPAVYVIMTLDAGGGPATVNLLAPLYLCLSSRRGRQVAGEGSLGLARTPLPQGSCVLQGGRPSARTHTSD